MPFPFEMIDEFFHPYWPQLGLDRDGFMNLARHDQSWGPTFSMTVLALRFSSQQKQRLQLRDRLDMMLDELFQSREEIFMHRSAVFSQAEVQ